MGSGRCGGSMKNSILLFALAAVGLLLASGCVNLTHDTVQTFKPDGFSQLVIDHQIGVNEELIGMMESIFGNGGYLTAGIPVKYAKLGVRVADIAFNSYANAVCDQVKEGAKCTVNTEGNVHLVATLQPGTDFYTVTTSTDWATLKEVKTYEIERVPTVFYFAAQGKSGREFGQKFLQSFADRFEPALKTELDNFFTTDFICYSSYPFTCEVLSTGNGNARFNLTSGSSYSSSDTKILWAACSDKNEEELTAVAGDEDSSGGSAGGLYGSLSSIYSSGSINATKVGAYVQSKTRVGKTPDSNGLLLDMPCSASSKSLVLVTEQETYDYDENYTRYAVNKTSVDVTPLLSKAAIMQNVSDAFSRLSTDSSFTSAADRYGANLSYYLISFDDGKVSQSDFATLNNSVAQLMQSANIANFKVSLTYAANFPDHVVSAKVGEKSVPMDGNGFKLTLSDMAALGKGRIVVRTERDLSPFGAMTWAIPLLLIILVAVWLVFKAVMGSAPKGKKGAKQA